MFSSTQWLPTGQVTPQKLVILVILKLPGMTWQLLHYALENICLHFFCWGGGYFLFQGNSNSMYFTIFDSYNIKAQ